MIIYLNGPPGCGKDTVAFILCKHFDATHLKFATPLKNAVAAFFNVPVGALEAWNDQPVVSGRARYRDILIGLSENVIKPMLGEGYFGFECANIIRDASPSDLHVISDAGFTDEVRACADTCGDPHQIIWHIHRRGTSFENDSREWVHVPGIPSYQLYNDCCKLELEERVCALYKESQRLFSSPL